MGYQNPIGLGKATCIAATNDAIKVQTIEHGILWVPQKVVHSNSGWWGCSGRVGGRQWFSRLPGKAGFG